jgi:signal peptidase II
MGGWGGYEPGHSMARKYVFLLVVSLAVVALDQWSKFLVLDRLTNAFEGSQSKLATFFGPAPEPQYDGRHYHLTDMVVFSDDFFRLRYEENPGAAFGLFHSLPERARGPLFHVISLGAVVLISFYSSRLQGLRVERFARWGLALVLGGAVGNYLDRLSRAFVIDFLEAHWFEKAYWPAFNIADSAICIGVGLLIIDSFVRKESPRA